MKTNIAAEKPLRHTYIPTLSLGNGLNDKGKG